MAQKIAVKIAPEPTYGLARRSNTRARPTMHEDHPDLDERGLQALQDALDSLNRRDALPEVRAWLDAGGDPNAFLGSYGPTPKSILSVALSYGRVRRGVRTLWPVHITTPITQIGRAMNLVIVNPMSTSSSTTFFRRWLTRAAGSFT